MSAKTSMGIEQNKKSNSKADEKKDKGITEETRNM